MPPDTVKYRIKNLVENRIIESFFVNLNLFILNYNTYLFSFQIFNRKKINEITKYLSNHLRCTGVLTTKSNWNLFGAILIKDVQKLKEFEEQFFSKFEDYIQDYEFIQILEQPYYRLFMKEIITSNK